MIRIDIPYAESYMTAEIEEKRIEAILRSKAHDYITSKSQEDIVLDALEKPCNSPGLSELARTAGKVLIITSDHTRPVPSKITMPLLLSEIRKNNTGVEVKILIATGCHRMSTREEIVNKFGAELAASEDIINHNCQDKEGMTFKGILPSGGELWVNSLVDWADLVIAEGFIEPHFFAGFSGGRKSILPGISARATVLANHCSKFRT
jgi:nickel-dependent lactate racemase